MAKKLSEQDKRVYTETLKMHGDETEAIDDTLKSRVYDARINLAALLSQEEEDEEGMIAPDLEFLEAGYHDKVLALMEAYNEAMNEWIQFDRKRDSDEDD